VRLIRQIKEKYHHLERSGDSNFYFSFLRQGGADGGRDSRLFTFYKKVMQLFSAILPYIRMTRILVTFIAPIILMTMYVIHQSYRTKRVRKFINNFKRDGAFLPLAQINSAARPQSNGIMELTQLNDMFWVRLTQVIATVIGY